MMKNYLFVGNFFPLVRGRHNKGMLFDDHALTKINFLNIMESQHGKDRMFHGKLSLKLIIYLPHPDGMSSKKQDERELSYHYTRPTISLLLKTFEDLLDGILFTDSCIIVAVDVEKRVSKEPRLEFIITEIE